MSRSPIRMPRPALYRWYQVAAIAVALWVVVCEMAWPTAAQRVELLFFAALVTVALFIRVGEDGTSVGFEAAVALAMIALFHNAGSALVAVFIGGIAYHAYNALSSRSFRITPLYEAAEAALSYYVVGLLYASAVARTAPAMAKISGYILLVIGYLVANVAFAALRKYLANRDHDPLDVRGILVAQGRTLLFATPLVAVEVAAYWVYGMAGFAVAF